MFNEFFIILRWSLCNHDFSFNFLLKPTASCSKQGLKFGDCLAAQFGCIHTHTSHKCTIQQQTEKKRKEKHMHKAIGNDNNNERQKMLKSAEAFLVRLQERSVKRDGVDRLFLVGFRG